jgi:hypothetical protein
MMFDEWDADGTYTVQPNGKVPWHFVQPRPDGRWRSIVVQLQFRDGLLVAIEGIDKPEQGPNGVSSLHFVPKMIVGSPPKSDILWVRFEDGRFAGWGEKAPQADIEPD